MMKKYLRILSLGFVVWVIPFIVSCLVWDTVANAPKCSVEWFYALMAFSGAIGFAIGAVSYFKDIKTDAVKESWIVGVIWYLELCALDLIVLVGAFGMSLSMYVHLLLTYLNTLILTVTVGYIKK